MTRNRFAVCDVKDLPPGERLLVEVDDRDGVDSDRADLADAEICLFNVDGDLFALGARCAHRGGPICKGDRTDEIVVCPWHGWEYDIETGAHLGAADARLPSYPVAIEDGTVYLAMESSIE